MAAPDMHVGAVQALADQCLALSELDLEIGSSGNASIRSHDTIAITASGSTFAECTDSQKLSLVALRSGKTIAGAGASSDVDAHRRIYAARPDVACIIHTHAHFVTLAAMLGQEIPPLCTMHADYFGTDIPIVPYANHRSAGFGFPHHFLNGTAFLLQNHGGLVLLPGDAIGRAAKTVSALVEVCHLYCDLVKARPRSEWTTVPSADAIALHSYYANSYGRR